MGMLLGPETGPERLCLVDGEDLEAQPGPEIDGVQLCLRGPRALEGGKEGPDQAGPARLIREEQWHGSQRGVRIV